MLKILIIIFSVILISCNNANNSTTAIIVDTKATEKTDTFSIKELFVNKDTIQGLGADIQLSFTKRTTTDTAIIYTINSTYKNKIVGFEITVPNSNSLKFTIKSTGVNSNNFVQVLAKLYLQKIDTSLQFSQLVIADGINIGNYLDSLNMHTGNNYVNTKSEYKLFFNGKNEDDYAELFLNINETAHCIELEEKDIDYRPMLIKILTQK